MGLCWRSGAAIAAATVFLSLMAGRAAAQPVAPPTPSPATGGDTLPSPYPTTGFAAPTLLPPPAAVYPETAVVAPPAAQVPTPAAAATPAPEVAPAASPIAEAAAPAMADAALVEAPPIDAAANEEVIGELTDTDAAPVRWYYPSYWFGPTPWDTGFELGINGSTGTSDTLSLRTGGYVKREGDRNKIDMSLYYNKTTAEGVETQSNAILDLRNDWLLSESPWTVFVMSQVFFDEFQAFDLNVNANTGIGYQVFDTEWVKLLTRLGAGASREIGGVDDGWVPEAQFGVNYEQKISETRKFYAKTDYFPEFEAFGDYRVLTDIGLEVELTQPANVSLKLSATDRYDSTPNGVRPHNTNYSVLLLWKH